MEIKIKERLENYRRVLAIARKPTMDEFKNTAKITGLGILVIGMIGFIIYIISFLFIG